MFIQCVRCLKIVILGFCLGISAQGFVPQAVHHLYCLNRQQWFYSVLKGSCKQRKVLKLLLAFQARSTHTMANNPQQFHAAQKNVSHSKAQTKQAAATYFQNYSGGTVLECMAAGQGYCRSSLLLPAPACLHIRGYTWTDLPFSKDNDNQALTDKVRQQEVCSASENSETAGSAWMNPLITQLLRQALKPKFKLPWVLYYLLQREHVSTPKGARF